MIGDYFVRPAGLPSGFLRPCGSWQDSLGNRAAFLGALLVPRPLPPYADARFPTQPPSGFQRVTVELVNSDVSMEEIFVELENQVGHAVRRNLHLLPRMSLAASDLLQNKQRDLAHLCHKFSFLYSAYRKEELSATELMRTFAARPPHSFLAELEYRSVIGFFNQLLRERKRFSSQQLKILLEYYTVREISTAVNRSLYLSEVEETLERNKHLIIRAFKVRAAPSEAFFHVEVLRGETHNRAEITCKVTLASPGGERVFYYKPRSGRVERRVMQLFTELHKCAPHKVPLHTYSIIDLKTREGKLRSLWPEIEGVLASQIRAGVLTLNAAIGALENREPPLPPGLLESYNRDLMRLERVGQRAGLGDLHSGNGIFTGLRVVREGEGERCTRRLEVDPRFPAKIAVIDFECIDPFANTPTGIGTVESEGPLSSAEQKAISRFREDCKAERVRLLLVGTERWVISSIRLPHQAALEINSALQKAQRIAEREGKEVYFRSKRDLTGKLLEDLLNGDVPYCTRVGDMVYWGPPCGNRAVMAFHQTGERKRIWR